jgi:murein DD-endopeptidase MepM/ murein hydrolase activator NlpD
MASSHQRIDISASGRADFTPIRNELDQTRRRAQDLEKQLAALRKEAEQLEQLGTSMHPGYGQQSLQQIQADLQQQMTQRAQELDATNRHAAQLQQQLQQANQEADRLDRIGQQLQRSWGQLASLVAGGLTASGMYGMIGGGRDRWRSYVEQIDAEARAIKELGRSYESHRNEIYETAAAYGVSTRELLALNEQIGRTLGRSDAAGGRLVDELRLVQGLSRGFGMDSPLELSGHFQQAAATGLTAGTAAPLSPREFAAMLAEAVHAGTMRGREDEVAQAIERLAQFPALDQTPFIAEVISTMNATGARHLQGAQGADILQRIESSIQRPHSEAGQLFMYRAFAGGEDLNLAQFELLRERGLAGVGPTGESNLQRVLEAIEQLPFSEDYRTLAGSRLLGVSMHELQELRRTFMPGGEFQTERLGGLAEALGPQGLQTVDPSAWPLLLDALTDPARAAREFQELSGREPVSTTDAQALFNQIREFAQDNAVLSPGQERVRTQTDLDRAAEQAGAKLYGLEEAADRAATALLNLTNNIPGPFGPLAAVAGAGAAGAAVGRAGSWLAGQAIRGLTGGGTAAGAGTAATTAGGLAARAAPAIGRVAGPLGAALAVPGLIQNIYEFGVNARELARMSSQHGHATGTWLFGTEQPDAAGEFGHTGLMARAEQEREQEARGPGLQAPLRSQQRAVETPAGPAILFPDQADAGQPRTFLRFVDALAQAISDQAGNIGQTFSQRFMRGMANVGMPGGGNFGPGGVGGIPGGVGGEGGQGGNLGGGAMSAIWGGSPNATMMQEFGHTSFSTGAGAWMYQYGTEFGLDGRMHPGLDIGMPTGTPLRSPVSGTVSHAGGTGAYLDDRLGNQPQTGQLSIKTSTGHEVILGHMENIAVRMGQGVSPGTYVGRSGTANGPHLHLEYRVPDRSTPSGQRIVDPRKFLAQQGWWFVPSDDMPTFLHRGEMVLPAPMAEQMRTMVGQLRAGLQPSERQTNRFAGDLERFEGTQAQLAPAGFAVPMPLSIGPNEPSAMRIPAGEPFGQDVLSAQGGLWQVPDDDMPARLHRNEMVLPAYLADHLRGVVGQAVSRQETRQAAIDVRVRIDPIQLIHPDGRVQTVQAQADQTFTGIITHPTGGMV